LILGKITNWAIIVYTLEDKSHRYSFYKREEFPSLEKRVRGDFQRVMSSLGWAPYQCNIGNCWTRERKMKATKKRVLDEDLSKVVLPCGELRNRPGK